jgi:hypothetical protein
LDFIDFVDFGGRQVTVIFPVRAHAVGDNAQQAPGVTSSSLVSCLKDI